MNEIIIGGMTYSIETNEEVRNDDNELCYGTCDFQALTIDIMEGLPEQRYNQTLVHEIMHAVFDEAGLEDNEDMVNRLSLVWYQVLTENKFDFFKQ